jgi:UDPglucose 6-dehydrogenase
LELRRALNAYSRNSGLTVLVVSNPEFLREGTAVGDFFHPDRIVVGVEDESAAAQMCEIYRPILERQFRCPVHEHFCPDGPAAHLLVTTINSAELIKHASNSFLALKISYANVIADLCEKIGADVKEVTQAMGARSPHQRRVPWCRPGLPRLLLPERSPSLRASRRNGRRRF